MYIKSKAKSSYFSQMQRPDTFLLLHASFLFTPSAKFCKTTIYDVYSRVVKTIKNSTFISPQIWKIFKKQSQLIFKTKHVLPSFSPQILRISANFSKKKEKIRNTSFGQKRQKKSCTLFMFHKHKSFEATGWYLLDFDDVA